MATKGLELLTLNSDIRTWFERFDYHILGNNLETEITATTTQEEKSRIHRKNLAIFISKVDGGVYQLTKSLVSPEKLEEKRYKDVKKLLIEHLSPKPTKFAQRYKFHKIVQNELSASDFIARL